jgi:hypothetical protein
VSEPRKSGMTFSLTEAQVKLIKDWMGPISVAHFHEECLPPGFEVVISFAGPIGCWASARNCGQDIELGDTGKRVL